jgi:DMSO/TMAO reductase YedYZ heme-binding membrane subunit/uncharacterized iron-regulated protein
VTLKTRVRTLNAAAWLGGLAPLGYTLWRLVFGDRLGVNPIEELTLWSGLTAVIFLLVGLAVTPLRRLTGVNEIQQVRRLLGLFAFFYMLLHFLVWMGLDQGFAMTYVAEDLTERPFIIVGAVSLLLTLPLAVTSTRGWVRRLGRNWVRLHWLVYPATGLGLLHYTWKQKADITDPLIAWSVFGVLMLYRILKSWRGRSDGQIGQARRLGLIAALTLPLALGACATSGATPSAPRPVPTPAAGAPEAPAPEAPAIVAAEGDNFFVYTADGAPATLDDVVAAMADYDAVLIGEEHNDVVTHLVQAQLLQRGWMQHYTERPVILSLEMFERDVQYIVDEYLADLITETHFLNSARPWGNYDADYRRMVEFAKAHQVPVVAANAPRRYANRASRLGRDSLETLDARARAHLPPLPYPEATPAYRAEWDALMGDAMQHMTGDPLDAQTLWDASMGHAIATSLDATPGALVLHMAGGFHVENGTGTPEALAHYRPGTRTLIVAARPAPDPAVFDAEAHAGLGDFVVLTRKP